MGEEIIMATNNFKPFGISNGANVTSQADYEALAALLTGFTAGKASSAQINKALRQGTVMASVLAQFISDSASVDVLDDGSTATILANLKKGMTALTPGRLLNVRIFTASGPYIPTQGTAKIKVRQVGGGGAGGGTATPGANQIASGNGGNGGSYGESLLMPVPTSSVTVNIGSGGVGVVGVNGAAGGTTSFGTYLVSPGGAGGNSGFATSVASSLSSDNASGANSTGSALLFSVPGNAGSGAFNISLASNSIKSGRGGDSKFGAGGGGTNAETTPKPGTGYGAGGSGNAAGQTAGASYAGAAGTAGIVIIEEYA